MLHQVFFQLVAHQRPDLVDCVLAGDLAAQLRVEVLRRGTGRFAGDGEAVLEHQDAEGQESKRNQVRFFSLGALPANVRFPSDCPTSTVLGGEVVLAGDVRLDVSRRDARRGYVLS